MSAGATSTLLVGISQESSAVRSEIRGCRASREQPSPLGRASAPRVELIRNHAEPGLHGTLVQAIPGPCATVFDGGRRAPFIGFQFVAGTVGRVRSSKATRERSGGTGSENQLEEPPTGVEARRDGSRFGSVRRTRSPDGNQVRWVSSGAKRQIHPSISRHRSFFVRGRVQVSRDEAVVHVRHTRFGGTADEPSWTDE